MTPRRHTKPLPDVIICRHEATLGWLIGKILFDYKDIAKSVGIDYIKKEMTITVYCGWNDGESAPLVQYKDVVIPIIMDRNPDVMDVINKIVIGGLSYKLAALAFVYIAIEFNKELPPLPANKSKYDTDDILQAEPRLTWYKITDLNISGETPSAPVL